MDFNSFTDLTIGDLVTGGRFLYINEPNYRVWLTRVGDEIHVQEEWPDVQALLDSNREEANNFSRSGGLGDMVKVASVPTWMVQQWEAEGADQDKVLLKRKLNDANYSKFRTNNLVL